MRQNSRVHISWIIVVGLLVIYKTRIVYVASRRTRVTSLFKKKDLIKFKLNTIKIHTSKVAATDP